MLLNSKNYGVPQKPGTIMDLCLPWSPYLVDFSHAPKEVITRPSFHEFLDDKYGIPIEKHMYLSDQQIDVLLNKHNMPIAEILSESESLCLDIYNKKLKKR